MAFMNFDKIGIFEQEGERVGLRPLEITTNWGENPILRAEVLSFFNESNALRRNKANLKIKNVIFNDPATIVIWSDDTKTVVKCQPGDTYSKELGLAMCISKKFLGNKGNFNEEFKKWIPEETSEEISVDGISIACMRQKLREYCRGKSCLECPLLSPVCRCGNGAHFMTRYGDGKYTMTDDEIRDAYKIVFGDKED